MNKPTLLFIHVDFNGIILQPTSEHHGRALMSGAINDELVYSKVPPGNHNFNDINQHWQFVRNQYLKPLPAEYITPEWIDLRTQSLLRLQYLQELEFLAKTATMNSTEYYAAPMFHGLLSTELVKCNPAQGLYTSAIQEWAGIQEVPVDTAFKELSIINDQCAGVFFRNHALYLKFVRILGQTSGEENMKQVCDDATAEFIRNSHI